MAIQSINNVAYELYDHTSNGVRIWKNVGVSNICEDEKEQQKRGQTEKGIDIDRHSERDRDR